MKYRIIVGFLVLAIVVSVGFNVYYYQSTVSGQVRVNTMRSNIILSWAEEMNYASYRLLEVTTNVDVFKVRPLLFIAGEFIAVSAELSEGGLYSSMAVRSSAIYELLMPYEYNSSQVVRSINSTAVEMIKTLAHKIQNVAGPLIDEWADLRNNAGIDPLQLLTEKGILDEVINGLDDAQNLAEQLYNFSPKFQ